MQKQPVQLSASERVTRAATLTKGSLKARAFKRVLGCWP